MLFVVGGAFVHLEKLLMDSRHKSSIGFGNKVGQLTQGVAGASLAGLPGLSGTAAPRRVMSAGCSCVFGVGSPVLLPPACCLPCLSAVCVCCVCVQVRAANMGRRGGPKIDSSILRQVEHADLINYGLIPEFVGRLPVIVSLQVGGAVVAVWFGGKAPRVCL